MVLDHVSDFRHELLAIPTSCDPTWGLLLRAERVIGLVVHELIECLSFHPLLLLLLCEGAGLLAVPAHLETLRKLIQLGHLRLLLLNLPSLLLRLHLVESILELMRYVLVHRSSHSHCGRELRLARLHANPRIVLATVFRDGGR